MNMRINNRILLFGIFFTVALLCVLSIYLLPVNAQSWDAAYRYYNECDKARLAVQDEINSANDDLQQLENVRARIEGELSDNAEDLRDGVRTSLVAAAGGDLGAGASALINAASDTMDGEALLSLFNSANSAISSQLGVISGIYTRAGTGYDAVYSRYQSSYNALSAKDKAIVKKATGHSGGIYPKMSQPSGSTYGLVACARPSSLSPTCYGYYTDADTHKETCSQKHGTSGETNVEWWSCFDSQCTRYPEHWVPCRAPNCTVLRPPPTITIVPPGYMGAPGSVRRTYHDHEVTCQASVYSFLNPGKKCGRKYFTCEGACPNKNSHTSGSGSTPPSSGTPTPTPAPTPSYHPCGVHLTSVIGNHSLQASCSSTDSNGNSCTVTSFYACDNHTHVYPAPPPPPPPPNLVECAHSNCSEMVSSRTSHRAQCGSGQHYYWPGCPNNTKWWHRDSTHELKSCIRSGCSNTWRSCQSHHHPYCSVLTKRRCRLR